MTVKTTAVMRSTRVAAEPCVSHRPVKRKQRFGVRLMEIRGGDQLRPVAPMLVGVFALTCLLGSPVRAGIQPTPFQDWSSTFLLQATGPSTDTLVRFGFNPFASSGLGPGGYPPDEIMPSTAPTIVVDVPSGTDRFIGFEILVSMDESLRKLSQIILLCREFYDLVRR